ncbi:MAG: hypothetical protein ACLVJO_03975 [[Clostridium] scindens]
MGAEPRAVETIMADIYNAADQVPSLLEEGSSMGAAVIGGVGTGIFKDTAIDRFINESVHTPDSRRSTYGSLKKRPLKPAILRWKMHLRDGKTFVILKCEYMN